MSDPLIMRRLSEGHVVSRADFDRFVLDCQNPPPPSARLVRLLRASAGVAPLPHVLRGIPEKDVEQALEALRDREGYGTERLVTGDDR